jgi:hypothetical protein
MNKAAKICEKADLIRDHLSQLAGHAMAGRAEEASKHFDEIFELTADIKSVAHNKED